MIKVIKHWLVLIKLQVKLSSLSFKGFRQAKVLSALIINENVGLRTTVCVFDIDKYIREPIWRDISNEYSTRLNLFIFREQISGIMVSSNNLLYYISFIWALTHAWIYVFDLIYSSVRIRTQFLKTKCLSLACGSLSFSLLNLLLIR